MTVQRAKLQWIQQYMGILGAVFLFAAIGMTLLLQTHAATSPASLDLGTTDIVTAPATIISDTTASNGSAIRFAGQTAPTGTQQCTQRDGTGGVPPGYYPGAACTGYTSAESALLKVPSQATSGTGWAWSSGGVQATANNITISGLEISGTFNTNGHTGVTLRNTWVRCTDEDSWCMSLDGNSNIVDAEIGDSSTPTFATGAWTGGPNSSFLRANIHDVSDGLRTDGGTTTTDSYIHALSYPSFPGAHSDGSQTTQSTNNQYPIQFIHNTIQGGNNDGLFFQAGSTITIQNNYFLYDNRAGQTISFAIGVYNVGGPLTITGNVFENSFSAGSAIYTYDSWPASTTINNNHLVNGTTVP